MAVNPLSPRFRNCLSIVSKTGNDFENNEADLIRDWACDKLIISYTRIYKHKLFKKRMFFSATHIKGST